MTRIEATLVERRGRLAAPVTIALLALLSFLAYVALQPVAEVEPPPVAAVSGTGAEALPVLRPSTVAQPSAATPDAPEARRMVSAAQATNYATHEPVMQPYRFMGKTRTGSENSIVLFGRGRVVTLTGPGPIDDEYTVDALFDDYLVLRHVPTAVGSLLQFELRQQFVEPLQDPEESPRD